MSPATAKIRLLCKIVLPGFALAVVFHYWMGEFLNLGHPWNSFLFLPQDRFNDWHNSVFSAATYDPYFKHGAAISAYFPFSYIVFLSAAGLSRQASIIYFLLISLVLVLGSVCLYWQVVLRPLLKEERDKQSLVALCVSIAVSYPLLFALDRGNIDAWIAAACLVFVSLLRTRFAATGSMALGIAIALKGYPAIFLLLAMVDRRYGQIILACGIALVLTLSALAFFDGGLVHNFVGLKLGLETYRQRYVLGFGSIHYSADPYNAIRLVYEIFRRLTGSGALQSTTPLLLDIYNLASFCIALVFTFFVLFVPCSRWRRVMAVCLLAILFPNVANDYKLLMLLPGLCALIADAENAQRETRALQYVAVLMVPKHYYFILGVSISSIISPIFLSTLAWNVLKGRESWRVALNQVPARLMWYCPWIFHRRWLFAKDRDSKMQKARQAINELRPL